MRISTNNNDPWHTKYSFAYKVTFNGKYIDNCILADESLGLVEVEDRDEDGNSIIENDYIKTHFEVGSVKIERDIFAIIKTSIEYFFIRLQAGQHKKFFPDDSIYVKTD